MHLVQEVAHVGLTVPDLAAALTMWCDDLGFTLERTFDLDESVTAGTTGVRSSSIHAATVVLGAHRIELLEYRPGASGAARVDPSQPGATHIALTVTAPAGDGRRERHRPSEASQESRGWGRPVR